MLVAIGEKTQSTLVYFFWAVPIRYAKWSWSCQSSSISWTRPQNMMSFGKYILNRKAAGSESGLENFDISNHMVMHDLRHICKSSSTQSIQVDRQATLLDTYLASFLSCSTFKPGIRNIFLESHNFLCFFALCWMKATYFCYRLSVYR